MAWQDFYERDAFIALVRDLARQEMSARQIASHFAASGVDGVTGNVIIGICYRARPRITLTGKSFGSPDRRARKRELIKPPARRELPAKAKRETRKQAVRVPEVEVAPGPPDGVHLMEVAKQQCRAPLWPDRIGQVHVRLDFAELKFCGAQTEEGQSFCESCRKRMYTRQPTPEEKPADSRRQEERALRRQAA